MTTQKQQATAQARYKQVGLMVLIFALFFLPLMFAYIAATQGTGYFKQTKNKGRLVQPLVPAQKFAIQDKDGIRFPSTNFNGHWSLLYVDAGNCDKACMQTLYNLRQLHIALGKDMSRVKRYVATFQQEGQLDDFLKRYSVDMQHLVLNRDQFAERTSHMHPKRSALTEGEIFIVDPLGNLTLSYAPETKPDDIYDDLKHLLGASQIG